MGLPPSSQLPKNRVRYIDGKRLQSGPDQAPWDVSGDAVAQAWRHLGQLVTSRIIRIEAYVFKSGRESGLRLESFTSRGTDHRDAVIPRVALACRRRKHSSAVKGSVQQVVSPPGAGGM